VPCRQVPLGSAIGGVNEVVEEKPVKGPPSTWFIILGWLSLAILPAFVALIAVFVVVGPDFGDLTPTDAAEALASPLVLMVTLLASWAALTTPALFASIGRGFRSVVAWSRVRWVVLAGAFAAGIGIQFVLGFLAAGASEVLGIAPEESSNLGIFNGFSGSWFFVVIIVAVLGAPIVEELFFRGLSFSVLLPKVGVAGTIVITSVLFGLLHTGGGSTPIGNIMLVAITAIGGAVFGYVRYRFSSVIPAIFAHAGFNSVAAFALILGAG